jgi:hypothetical protein
MKLVRFCQDLKAWKKLDCELVLLPSLEFLSWKALD